MWDNYLINQLLKGSNIKTYFNKLATKYRLWMCEIFEHNVDCDAEHYRVREDERRHTMPSYLIEDDLYHFERYSTCKRCGKDIRYIRFFNFWRSEEEVKDKFGAWLDKSFYSERWSK